MKKMLIKYLKFLNKCIKIYVYYYGHRKLCRYYLGGLI